MEPLDPAAILSTIGVFGFVVKSVVDALRRHYPRIEGLAVQGIAWALGAGSAWAFDLQAAEAMIATVGATVGRIPVDPVDYLITGAAIAAGSGFLAEISGRSGQTPTIVEVDSEGNAL